MSPYVPIRDRPLDVPTPQRLRRVSGTVFLLGFTSLFTDLASEMVTAVLPMFLTVQLGFTALQFGLIDGIYQGATALVRVGSGVAADRTSRPKQVATTGYVVSAVCKLALLASAAWAWITAAVLVDRLGKGVRSAPRDSMISLSSRRATLAESFGVHRALDTVGALLGPIAAFVVLSELPDQYDSVFLISFCFALVGVSIIWLFVRNPPVERSTGESVPRAAVSSLLRATPFRSLVIAASALGLFTISEPFVYLVVQDESDLAVRWFPLLFAGTALSFLVLAVPAGRLADRVGRGRVFTGGFVVLVVAYAILRFAPLDAWTVLVILVLLGAFAAATDGVLMAMASALLPGAARATGLATLSSAVAISRFLSSLLFGAAWFWWGWRAAVVAFAAGLVVVVAVTRPVLVVQGDR